MGSSRTRNSTRASKARLAKPPSTPESPDAPRSELCRELESIALRLRAIYSVGLIIKLAIDGLDGEHDADLAYCLGWNVLDPVAAQLAQLSSILVKLGGDEITLL